MSLPELPPRRSLPPDVRERMRHRVLGRSHRPLAVAAAVAVLVGGLVVARSVERADGPAAFPTTPPTTSHRPFSGPEDAQVVPTTTADLSRCGFTTALFTVRLNGRRVLAAPGERFCELTHATTSTSTLAVAVPLGDLEVRWRSPSGVLVGKVPPDLVRMSARATIAPLPSVLADHGYFVARPSPRGAVLELSYRERPDRTQPVDPAAVPVTAKTVDFYPSGVADPAANVLDRCLDHGMLDGTRIVSDVVPWQLGAVVAADTDMGLAVLRGPSGNTAYCHVDQYRAVTVEGPMSVIGSRTGAFHVRALYPRNAGRYVLQVGGTLREDVHRVELLGGTDVQVELKDRTFAAVVGLPSLEPQVLKGVRLTVYAADGTVLQSEPLH
ncbi:hypothetical protein SUDANB95_01414 [Actinosynnema sp. ALI-1.44]